MNMLEAIGDKSTDDLGHAEAVVPPCESRGLLAFVVVLRADEHQRRTDGGLEDAQENTGSQKRRVVFGTCRRSSSHAPQGDVDSKPLGCGHFLETVD